MWRAACHRLAPLQVRVRRVELLQAVVLASARHLLDLLVLVLVRLLLVLV